MFPTRLSPTKNANANFVEQFGLENIGLQLWKTRCSNPRLDLIYYDAATKTIKKIERCQSVLKNFFSDVDYEIETSFYDTIIAKFVDYNLVNGWYYNPSRGKIIYNNSNNIYIIYMNNFFNYLNRI